MLCDGCLSNYLRILDLTCSAWLEISAASDLVLFPRNCTVTVKLVVFLCVRAKDPEGANLFTNVQRCWSSHGFAHVCEVCVRGKPSSKGICWCFEGSDYIITVLFLKDVRSGPSNRSGTPQMKVFRCTQRAKWYGIPLCSSWSSLRWMISAWGWCVGAVFFCSCAFVLWLQLPNIAQAVMVDSFRWRWIDADGRTLIWSV